jgi:hypothetical protein
MLKLIAAAFPDGYAYVEDTSGIFAIRPPYHARNKYEVSLQSIEAAIAHHGFLPCDLQFSDWASLTQYLKEQLVQHRQGGEDFGSVEKNVRELVMDAPVEVVELYLEQIERDLMPGREWEAVSSLLISLLRNPVVTGKQELNEKCLDLLAKLDSERLLHSSALQNLVQNPSTVVNRWKHVTDKDRTLADTIRRSRRVLENAA